jgi:hypothetical protein
MKTPAPFVVGAARSGTTMLRLMLDAHGELAIPPETGFVPQLTDAARRGAGPDEVAELLISHRRFGDFGFEPDEIRAMFSGIEPFRIRKAIRAFYRTYAERQGKSRWGDKTPAYALRMREIARVLPEAHFIHLIRDGRDVRLSQLANNTTTPPPAGRHAQRWKKRVRTAQRQGSAVDHYMEVRFEDVLTDTEAQIRRMCEFVELDYDPAMLRFHERAAERLDEIRRDMKPGDEVAAGRGRQFRSAEARVAQHLLTTEPPRADRIARWRGEMSADDLDEFEGAVGDFLVELGYELSEHPAP